VRTGNKRQAPALFARVSRPPGREDYAVANAGRFDCSWWPYQFGCHRCHIRNGAPVFVRSYAIALTRGAP
jgi:hypothetical protein